MDKRKSYKLDRLFKLSGIAEELVSNKSVCMNVLKQRFPRLSERFFAKLDTDETMNSLINQVKELYDQTFTDEEIDDLITFWSSPVGQKLGGRNFRWKQALLGESWADGLQTKCRVEADKSETQDGKLGT